MIRLLFIDDDPQAQRTLKLVLDGECEVSSAFTGRQGIQRVREQDPDVVLLDIALPDLNGLEVLKRIVALPAAPPVVMLTMRSDVELIVSAVKLGAYHYVVKPYNVKTLTAIIRQAALSGVRIRTVDADRGEQQIPELSRLVGESPAIRRVRDLVLRFGRAGSPVLLLGESGTGKELAARAIHAISERDGQLVPLNCAALPETLAESELFGTTRGAYTDAVDRSGAFERADSGSLFLDEIGEMAPGSQAKLLRALEDGEVSRLGASRPSAVDVRVIAASRRNLRDDPRFREDLYYRLEVLKIPMPPLRERREDIPLLAVSFLEERRRKDQSSRGRRTRRACTFSDGALSRLVEHCWPGNVRQLRNVVERAAVMADGERIEARDILID